MAETKIEWTDATWNPLTGCDKISPGCKNCYAEKMALRLQKMGQSNYANGFALTLQPHMLEHPLRWKKPRMIFVNSMSDLFHKDVPFEFIDEVFAVMMASGILDNRHHTFQVLTKRPERMLEYLTHRPPVEMVQAWAKAGDRHITMDNEDILFSETVMSQTCHDWDKDGTNSSGSEYKQWGYLKDVWPLHNVWLGVSVEDRKYGLPRIDYLCQIPAAVRMLSCEPLLEDLGEVDLTGIHWVITGGESGPNARPAHPDWFRSLRDQCQAAGVAFHFKQWGEYCRSNQLPPNGHSSGEWLARIDRTTVEGDVVYRVGKKAAGRLLDGREHNDFPESKAAAPASI